MKITIGNNKNINKAAVTEASEEVKAASEGKTELVKERRLCRRIYSGGYKKTIADFHGEPVFYKTEDGGYREIDNTLADSGDCLEAARNSFRTRFFKHAEGGKVLDVDQDGHTVELISLDAASRGCVAENCSEKARERTRSTVVFRGISDNSDLEYTVSADRVKENIVINSRAEKYEYSFAMNTSNLYAAASEDGSCLELRRRESAARQFYIPSPIMFDAAGAQSDAAYYEVSEENADRLIIKVIADADWINAEDRVFPVVIDPQIVVDNYYGGGVYNNADLPNGERSIFSYETYCNDVKTSANGMRIYYDASKIEEGIINSKIYIDKSRIASRLLNGLNKATLELSLANNSKGNCFCVGHQLFIEQTFETGNIVIDITNLFNEFDKIVEVQLENWFSRGIVTNNDIKFHSPVLRIEADVDYYGGEENVQPATKAISGAGGMENVVRLKDGDARPCFTSLSADSFAIPLNVTHIFTDEANSSPFGTGWRLNSERKLVKSDEDALSNTLFTYTDEFGDQYQFIEKYYYKEGGKKVFVNKDDVYISLLGELTDDAGHKIQTCQYCCGYTLVSELDDFNGVEYVEQRQDEQIQLENYVNQYSQTLKNYVIADSKTGDIIKRLGTPDISHYDSFIKEVSYSDILVSESEAYQLQSMYLNLQQLEKQITELEASIDSSSGDEQEQYKQQKEEVSAQNDLVEAQFNYIVSQARNNLAYVKSVFKDYFNKEEQLELLYRQTPVNYIKGEDGTISGFNKYGDLVLEADAYGNYIAIDRDKDGLITEIYDDKNTVLTFEYANGKLASITDSLGRKVSYTYSGDMLVKAAFADGSYLSFGYSYNRLYNVQTGEGSSTEYRYDNIMLKSITTRAKGTENSYMVVSDYDFTYGADSTKVTDGEGGSEEYTFLETGEVSSCTQRDNAGNVIVTNYSYSFDSGKNKIVTEVTQQNSDPAVTVTRTYNDIRQITSEVTDWQSISESVRVKTEVQYSYDLNNRLTEKKTCKYVETNGETEEVVAREKYSYNAQGMPVLTESFIEGEEQTGGINYEQKVYDDNGNVVKTISWNSLDSSSKFYSESEVAENGQVTADKDETGAISAEYEYISGSNVVNSIKYPNGGRLAYGRNPYNFAVTSVTQSTEEGEANTNDIVYKNGMPVEVKSGSTVISYTYDGKGRKKSYAIDGVQQATYSYGGYSESGGNITYGTSTQNLADGTAIVTSKTGVADSAGRVKVTESVKADGTTIFSTLYNEDGLTEQVTDGVSGVTSYTYDSYKNVTKITAATLTESYTYNGNAELTQKTLSGAVDQAYSYAYKDNAAHNLEYVGMGNYKFYPLTDVNGRNTGREIYSGENKLAAEYITYRKVGDHATNMPASVWFASGSAIKESIKYKYDSCGNIAEIMQNGHLVARYKYDSLNRLVREDNKPMNKTVIFTYDTAGNITERCEYAYTSKDGEELSELACTHYSYDYEGDRLVSYNGESIVYNVLGNPTSYRGNAVEWQYGNRLTKYGTTTFAYDGAGRRVSKGSITFTYDSAGNLIKQSDGLEFVYDNSGVIGVKYNGNTYFYRRDCQGNIIAILDNNGAVVVEYKYDAWGNHEAEVASEEYVTLANLNPFRYRGYYYDSETDLYFLQTRYYDPVVGRFISRDSIEYADPETICGLNLYAYCGNNPVMATDPTGRAEWWEWLVAGIVIIASAVAAVFTAGTSLVVAGAFAGIAFGGTLSIVNQLVTTGDFNLNQFAIDALGGALSGALAATGIGVLGQIVGNITFSLGTNLLYSGLTGAKLTWQSITESFVVGLVSGLAGWNGAQYIGKAMVSLAEKYMVKILSNGKLVAALSASSLASLTNTLVKAIWQWIKKRISV